MHRQSHRGGIRHYIGGKFVSGISGQSFDDINPSNNSVICRVAEGLAEDIDLAVSAARRAFEAGGWRSMQAGDRSQLLLRVSELILERAEDLALAETLDTGIPLSQTRGQMQRAAENFSFFASVIPRLEGELFPSGSSFLNYTLKSPVGVAGLITPWNTPLMLETWKVAPCLAAGNTCVLKPAEWSPLTASLLAEIMRDAEIPPGVFNTVNGYGETAGAALVAHPAVRLISFTGETSTGREIIRNGASTLKRFSMELGGKSPAVVFDDADLGRALDATVFGGFSLNGERCTANSRLLVQESIYGEFTDSFAERAENIVTGDPFDENTELGPLIHPDHWKRVNSYIAAGKAEGAKIAAGGGRPGKQKAGNYMDATLMVNVRSTMKVAQEEIFGPVVVAIPFSDEREAVALANDTQYGLASYIWTASSERANRVAASIESGLCWINSHNVRDLRTPFGGAKNSGIGREGGVYSFDFYMEEKTVHMKLDGSPAPVMGAVNKGRSKK